MKWYVRLIGGANAGVQLLYFVQATVYFEQRGAGRSPTTFSLSMLQARTRPLLAFGKHACSPKLGECHSASPDLTLGGANWALAALVYLFEDGHQKLHKRLRGPYLIASVSLNDRLRVRVVQLLSQKKPPNYL